MTGNLWAFLFWGLLALIPALFVALRRLTAAKQKQLSPDEFQRWFQKVYLGFEVDQVAEAGRATVPSKTERVSTGSSQGGLRRRNVPGSERK